MYDSISEELWGPKGCRGRKAETTAKGRKLRHTASLSCVDSGRKSDLPRQGISEAGEAVWQLGDCEEACSC